GLLFARSVAVDENGPIRIHASFSCAFPRERARRGARVFRDVRSTNLPPNPDTFGDHEAPMNGPNPANPHPMVGFPQVCFIKNTVRNPNIIVGDYTYYDDPDDSENFERNVLYHYPFVGDKLII